MTWQEDAFSDDAIGLSFLTSQCMRGTWKTHVAQMIFRLKTVR